MVGDSRCDCEPEQEPEAEEKPDRELLGTLRGGVHPEQYCKGHEEPADCPAGRRVAANVGAECEETAVSATRPIVCPKRRPAAARLSGTEPAVVIDVVVTAAPSVCVVTLGQDLRGVFGVCFVDEETRGAGEVERVGAACGVCRDYGWDS